MNRVRVQLGHIPKSASACGFEPAGRAYSVKSDSAVGFEQKRTAPGAGAPGAAEDHLLDKLNTGGYTET